MRTTFTELHVSREYVEEMDLKLEEFRPQVA